MSEHVNMLEQCLPHSKPFMLLQRHLSLTDLSQCFLALLASSVTLHSYGPDFPSVNALQMVILSVDKQLLSKVTVRMGFKFRIRVRVQVRVRDSR